MKRRFSKNLFGNLSALILAVGTMSAQAALTYPGCTDLASTDFREVVLVGRGTSPVPMVNDATLYEPLSVDVGSDGRVYWAERKASGGANASSLARIRRFNPADSTVKTLASIAVATGVGTGQGGNAELGLRYFILDPNFSVNRYAYILYTPATTATGNGVDTMRVSRVTMPTNDSINMASEQRLLSMPWTPGICCHQGGNMDWDAQGNLYITTGNNAANSDGFGPMDTVRNLNSATGDNKDRAVRDNQARTANTMDWRGKVLRIKPDNSPRGYSIPAGNLRQRFYEIGGAWVAGQDTNKILPEIYTFGHRNPYSLAVDRATGWVAIGEVGPDNNTFTAARGAVGREEYNMIRRPGFYGFPYFIGEGGANGSYNMYNPATAAYDLPYQNADSVFNNSPNNTGVTRLPRAIPATIANARNGTQPTPGWITTTGNAAHAGPIYRYNNSLVSARKMPPHLNGKWILFEGADHWVNVATLNDSGVVTAVDPFPGAATLFRGSGNYGIIDMRVGPDGAIYAVGYNNAYFNSGANTRITRVEYTGNCTGPVAVDRPSEQRRKALAQGVLFAPQSGSLMWPVGMTSVQAFDLQGRQIFALTRAAGENEVAVPRGLGSSLLRVRFTP